MAGEINRRYAKYCALLAAGFGLFRAAVMGLTGPGDSESYYWAWSQHPSLSYYDHPPMVAWLIGLSTGIGGHSTFMMRLPSLILFMAMMWLLYKLAMTMFNDGRVAFHSLLIFNLFPMFGIGALQMVPDIPAAVCYLLFILVAHKLLVNDGPRWLWYVLGVIMGVGLLGKYFEILALPCAMLLVAAVPRYRHWYARPEPYIMGVVALLFFSPVIIWNFANDWPSFKFHLVSRHHWAGFSWSNFQRLVAGQALYSTPLYWIAALWACWKGAARGLKGDLNYATLAAFSIPTLAFFYGVTWWTDEAEPHWPAFGYIPAIVMISALGVEGFTKWKLKTISIAKWGYGAATVMAGAAFALFYIHVFHPILPIKPKYDITNEILGWEKVGPEIQSLYDEIKRKEGKEPFTLAHHWVLCSQMMFSTDGKVPVSCINEKIDEYDFWDDEKSLAGKTAIVVTDLRFEEKPDTLYRFSKVEKVKDIPVTRGGEVTRLFTLWVGKDFNGSLVRPPLK